MTLRMSLTFATAACATTRSPAKYRQDTHTLLESRSSSLEACYEKALETEPSLEGKLTIHFVVKKRTGEILKPTLDTSVVPPQQLALCVFDALDGLRLEPADGNDGDATFVFEFRRMPLSSDSFRDDGAGEANASGHDDQ